MLAWAVRKIEMGDEENRLSEDKRKRTIRLFFTDGHLDMIVKAAQLSYRFLYQQEKLAVYASISKAFNGPPTALKNFPESQKIYLSFRLGIACSYKEIQDYLDARKLSMGPFDVCLLSALSEDPVTQGTLIKNMAIDPKNRHM